MEVVDSPRPYTVNGVYVQKYSSIKRRLFTNVNEVENSTFWQYGDFVDITTNQE